MIYDGCTFFPDGWPTWLGGRGDEWLPCCDAHDLAYLNDTITLLDHLELGQCMAASGAGPLIGALAATVTTMWWLVRHRLLRRRT